MAVASVDARAVRGLLPACALAAAALVLPMPASAKAEAKAAIRPEIVGQWRS
jgi:hypothetical protein